MFEKGKSIFLVNDSKIEHKGNSSANKFIKMKSKSTETGTNVVNFLFYKKHFGIITL